MKEPILSKDLQILQDILFAVSLSPLNSFFHSGINFLMQPVCSYHSRTASFSASVFFGGACNMLKFARNHFCLACEAEARHMYCFSGGGVVVVVVGGGVNFLCLGHFLENYKG